MPVGVGVYVVDDVYDGVLDILGDLLSVPDIEGVLDRDGVYDGVTEGVEDRVVVSEPVGV